MIFPFVLSLVLLFFSFLFFLFFLFFRLFFLERVFLSEWMVMHEERSWCGI